MHKHEIIPSAMPTLHVVAGPNGCGRSTLMQCEFVTASARRC